MVGERALDRLVEPLAAEILDRHADGGDRALAGLVGELAGHVGQHADLDDIVGDPRRLAVGRATGREDERQQSCGACRGTLHRSDPPLSRWSGLRPVTCIARLTYFPLLSSAI